MESKFPNDEIISNPQEIFNPSGITASLFPDPNTQSLVPNTLIPPISNLKGAPVEDFFFSANSASVEQFSKLNNFFKNANCHLCKRKKVVYGCFKDYMPTQCPKMFCTNCLEEIYKENILDIINKSSSWQCPYKKRICTCKQCNNNLADFPIKPTGESRRNETNYNTLTNPMTMNKSNQAKIKNLIEFNANLIMKYQKNYDALNEDEKKFYIGLIHENLEKLNDLSNFAMTKKLVIKE